jgi:hypothetical protein
MIYLFLIGLFISRRVEINLVSQGFGFKELVIIDKQGARNLDYLTAIFEIAVTGYVVYRM